MRSPIATLFIMATLSAQTYGADTIGTIANGAVVMVAPAPTVLAFICSPTWKADTCWPDTAGSSVSALVSSMAPTQHVWASIGGATPRWVPLSSVAMPSAPQPVKPTEPSIASSPQWIWWDWPTSNTDGSPITDLIAWKVYVGTASKTYAAPVSLPVGTTKYQLPPTPGTYYVVVTAVSTSGGEGRRSAEAVVTIDPPQVLRCVASPPLVAGMQATITATCTYGP